MRSWGMRRAKQRAGSESHLRAPDQAEIPRREDHLDGGLPAYRELDEVPGLPDIAITKLLAGRREKKTRYKPGGCCGKSVFGRLAGYEDVNDTTTRCGSSRTRWPTTSPTSCAPWVYGRGSSIGRSQLHEKLVKSAANRRPRPLRRVPAGRSGGAASAVRRHPPSDRVAQAEAISEMTARLLVSTAARERCVRHRSLGASLPRSAATAGGEPAWSASYHPVRSRKGLSRRLIESMMVAEEPVSGKPRLGLCPMKRRGGVVLCNTLDGR
jgi:hypothetical protein